MATAAVRSVTYKDFDLAFRPHPVTGKLVIKKDYDSVKQGVRAVVLTNRYERPFRPMFGSDVRAALFEPIHIAVDNITYATRVAMENHQPRAELLDASVTGDPDSHELRVNIVFRPINSTTVIDQPISLRPVR